MTTVRGRLAPAATLTLACAGLVSLLFGRVAANDQDTHGRNAAPDYRRVFSQDAVNRLEIRVAASDWQAVLADMQSMAGPSGFGLNVGFSEDQIAACAGLIEANTCRVGTPPTNGRCVQPGFPPGQLACLPIAGAGNAGRDEVELLPRTPVYAAVRAALAAAP